MRTAPLHAFLLLLAAGVAHAAPPPRVTAGTLPGWWPTDEFAYSTTRPVLAEDYAEASFRTGPRSQDKTTLRGRHWHAEMVRTREELKEKAVDTNAKWAHLRSALEGHGFRIVWLEDSPRASWLHATLVHGQGDTATWVTLELSRPFNTGEMEAIQVAPNPFSIQLTPPASTPETFTDQDDFPYLKPPPGARLTNTTHWQHPMTFAFSEKGHDSAAVGTGFIEKYYKADPTLSRIALHDGYVAALQQAGWTVMPLLHTPTIQASYVRNGRELYAQVSQSSIAVADVRQELAAALAKDCKASVYGIHFDFNQATLRPDSTPTLEQVAMVLRSQPGLEVEIGGHTDNVGKPDYNRELSDRRAAAVKVWLTGHGIAGSRLTSHGYGDTQPLVKNDSDEHRAQNRRVELRKRDCK